MTLTPSPTRRLAAAPLALSVALLALSGCTDRPAVSAAADPEPSSPAAAAPIKPMRSSVPDGPDEAAQLPPGHPPIDPVAQPVRVERMPPPPGGLAIAEVWAARQRLAGQTVTVRGTVVKFNGGILGTNWLHLRDGSGEEAEGTHDLTVTTQGEARPGEVITATGTLAIDRDFGAGYRYAVILERATLGPR